MSIFRTAYRALTADEADQVRAIKERAESLLEVMLGPQTVIAPRELALARTKLEESVMWAVKAITG